MVNFYTGCVMSGKTKLLSDIINLFDSSEYLLIVPKIVFPNDEVQVKSRAEGYEGIIPDIRIDKSTDLTVLLASMLDNSNIRLIVCDEIQFFEKDQIDQLFNIEKIFNLKIVCFGLLKTHRNTIWDVVQYLINKKPKYTEILSCCTYCENIATTNIRFDFNSSERIDDCGNDGDKEKYFPVCERCYKARDKRSYLENN